MIDRPYSWAQNTNTAVDEPDLSQVIDSRDNDLSNAVGWFERTGPLAPLYSSRERPRADVGKVRLVFNRGVWLPLLDTANTDVGKCRRRSLRMISLVVAAMALLGGTTFLALQQSIARNPALNRCLTGIGIVSCLLVAVLTLAVTAVTLP